MSLRMIFLDAGQGDSTLIIYPDNSLILVDCGSKKNKNIVSTEIAAVLNRYLLLAGNKIKALVLTHPDGDHYNLVTEVILAKKEKVTVNEIYYGGDAKDHDKLTKYIQSSKSVGFSKPFGSVGIVKGLSYSGTSEQDPSVDVRILAASISDPKLKEEANPNSIVLLLSYAYHNIFLMGDSTTMTEVFIFNKFGKYISALTQGKSNILKVGHHGSNTSSATPWLNLVSPEDAFISSDTKSFNGRSLPRSTIVNNVLAQKQMYTLDKKFTHKYVQYNDATDRHEQISTTKALFTNLYLLKFTSADQFVAYGTSWYFQMDADGKEYITPACDWANIDKAY